MDKSVIFTENNKIRYESTRIEYKESFQPINYANYFKTMMAFANNRGGTIFFGVKDNPREVVGLSEDSSFHKIKPELLSQNINKYFSKAPKYMLGSFDVDENTTIGYINIKEERYKPIICKCNFDNVLKEGAIYYRYNGTTKLIEYGEINHMINEIKENERRELLSSMQTILRYGPENTRILRTDTGELDYGENVKIIVDAQLLQDLRKASHFIDSASISEVGRETIKVVGSIEPANTIEVIGNPNETHPYRQKELADILGVNTYIIQVLIWKHNIKGDSRYHYAHKNGKNFLHKFSRETISFLKKYIQDNKYIEKIKKEYSQR